MSEAFRELQFSQHVNALSCPRKSFDMWPKAADKRRSVDGPYKKYGVLGNVDYNDRQLREERFGHVVICKCSNR